MENDILLQDTTNNDDSTAIFTGEVPPILAEVILEHSTNEGNDVQSKNNNDIRHDTTNWLILAIIAFLSLLIVHF